MKLDVKKKLDGTKYIHTQMSTSTTAGLYMDYINIHILVMIIYNFTKCYHHQQQGHIKL